MVAMPLASAPSILTGGDRNASVMRAFWQGLESFRVRENSPAVASRLRFRCFRRRCARRRRSVRLLFFFLLLLFFYFCLLLPPFSSRMCLRVWAYARVRACVCVSACV